MINMDTEKDYGEAHLNPLAAPEHENLYRSYEKSHGFGRRRRAFHP